MSRFQTDSLNPTALNTGVLGRKRGGPSTRTHTFLNNDDDANARDPDAARNKFAADWNTRIDREMRAVSGGLKELVELADIGPSPAPHTSIPTSLHLQIRTAQLIRATQSIRDMAHELRLMLLLSDETGAAARRDAEAAAVGRERRRYEGEVMRAVGAMTGQIQPGSEYGAGDGDEQGAERGARAGGGGGSGSGTQDERDGPKFGAGAADGSNAEIPAVARTEPGALQPVGGAGEMDEDSDEFEEL